MHKKFWVSSMVIGTAAGLALITTPAAAGPATTIPAASQPTAIRLATVQPALGVTSFAAGYLGNGTFSTASARWNVPSISASSTDTEAYNMLAIVDAQNNDVALTTSFNNTGGKTQYFADWNIFIGGKNSSVFINVAIKPGDSIDASLARVNSTTWTAKLTDNTTKKSFSANETAAVGPGDVNWLVGTSDTAQLSKFAQIKFTNLLSNGSNPGLVNTEQVYLDRNDSIIAAPSLPNSSKNGFSVLYTA